MYSSEIFPAFLWISASCRHCLSLGSSANVQPSPISCASGACAGGRPSGGLLAHRCQVHRELLAAVDLEQGVDRLVIEGRNRADATRDCLGGKVLEAAAMSELVVEQQADSG